MSEEAFERARSPGSKLMREGPYTTKDFQLEVLGQLAEVRGMTEELQEKLADLDRDGERHRLLRFDGRTLVAIGAIALSLTGYVLQDARNTTKRDADIEAMRIRVSRLEEIAATNTEGRLRMELQLGELRDGQAEIKQMIAAHDNGKKLPGDAGRAGGGSE